MEPKDLKNSEELKRTEKSEPKNSEVETTSDEATKPVTTETVNEEKVAETPSEPVSAQTEEPVEETPAEEPKTEAKAEEPEEKPVETPVEDAAVEEEVKVEDASEPEVEVTETETTTVEAEQKESEKEDQETAKDEAKAPKQEAEPVPEKEPVDYSNHSQVELVNALRDIIEDENNDYEIKDDVEAIKAVFYKNLNETIEEEKKKFIDAGGTEDDFKPEDDPYEKDIKDLLKKYRQIRIDFNKKMEGEKEDNLQKKYDVIEKIKGLINNEESINKTFNEFRDLQREWREIGLVPQSKMKDLWDTYHFHVENFYDYIKINRELRDLDLKKNLEAKIKLCERAEELLVEEPSILKAFNTLQKYHDQWREIGPVPREQKDDIWERFKAATTKINKKHQDFFENRKLEQKKNLEAKTALCEKAEEIILEEITKHKDWDEKSKQLIELQKVWRTIGFAPRKDNNKIYERFRTACDKFFDTKRAFYAKNKESQQNNLQLKTDLCVQAESLKDSDDWKKTTQDFINIQKKWKEIGPVPRKHSDILWKRFRAACDFFFDKKSEHFSDVDTEQVDNLKLKEELIKEVQNFKPAEDNDKNLESLKEFQRKWTEIGHVPFKKKDDIKVEFRDAINKLFDELNIDEEKRNLLKFKNKMSSFSESSRGQNKMRMERDKYMNKMKQLENDLVLLDNNIGFFAKSKNAESLIEDVKKKIEVTKQKIELLRDKIRVIDEMDGDE
ncbi:DUF349 domain-containing protein [Draconibacterium sp. IB214405]|uniref:DUF349 domain-containing protein n=1 Tax=Draconibacterium sp. IB214405 TaxID=3097352 RepID=UPI002A0E1811|nr:DUF349 domain-containing protein [Draconibacterium sp. IB214405]MDX8339651.1 DUF349 domain-containing protein [Draconibacterium sp. IB214405]